MIREYLSSLEKCYGYTGNWQPNSLVHVGDWADVELGFLPWLKGFLGISYKSLEINKNLHSVMRGSLGDLDVKKEKRASMMLSHDVSIGAAESGRAVSIKAQKKGGFFAVFQEVQEYGAQPAAFRDKLRELNKTSVAVVAGATYVKKGFLVVFNRNTASLTLSGGSSLDVLIKEPSLMNLDFDISYECEGIAVYQAEPSRPLIPFLKIYIAEREKHNGFDGRLAVASEDYGIAPFSYNDFFRADF